MIGIAVAVGALAVATRILAQKPQLPARAAAPTGDTKLVPVKPVHEADEKLIRRTVDDFSKAYNAHDAKAVGALFTADAEIVNEDGVVTQGRAEIERAFGEIFEEDPETQISIAIKSIRFLGLSVAVEDGTSSVIPAMDEPAERSRYTAVHVRQDGRWLMASARDLADEPTEEDQLKQLEWMIGDWVDESPDALIVTSAQWTDNHHFILSKFTIQVAGRPLMNGSQRIGWDPLAKVIRSWVFDSEGGFAEGIYSHDGNQWIVKLSGVTRDGKLASSTNTTTIISKDRLIWQSRDRMVGGEAQADTEEVMVVRKPPAPM